MAPAPCLLVRVRPSRADISDVENLGAERLAVLDLPQVD
jgi:hypothetical protein